MTKAILFDLGGVLFTDGTKQFVKFLHDERGIEAEKVDGLINGDLGSRYREGKISRDEFWQTFKKELSLQDSEADLEAKWIGGYHIMDGTKQLIEELSRKGYAIYYLSDNVQERIDYIEAKYHFLSLFKDGVFSHIAGVRKPNPKIYELAIEKAGVPPEEIVFIDDKQSALEPAKAMGMQTVWFEDPATTRAKLISLNAL